MRFGILDTIIALSHHILMRTTLTLDDDILKEAADRARILKTSLGKAVSDLARRGLQVAPPVKRIGDLAVFDPPKGAPKITMRKLRDALSDFP
jgi:hypothetical protein